MPHVWEMGERLAETGEPDVRPRRSGRSSLDGAWYSFRLALAGFVLGSVVGIALAVVMARFDVVRRGLLPYLVVSQTVPLIALAPLVVSWGGRLQLGGWEWPRWLSVAVLGAFLAFFPVAVGTLRGLESAPATSLELMRSFAAIGGQTMRKLRFPAAVPHMVPALKLAGAASVIGVVVAEISTGVAWRHRPADPRVLPPGDRRPGRRCTRRCSARRCSGWRWPASSRVIEHRR